MVVGEKMRSKVLFYDYRKAVFDIDSIFKGDVAIFVDMQTGIGGDHVDDYHVVTLAIEKAHKTQRIRQLR